MWLIGFVLIISSLVMMAILGSVFNWDNSILNFFIQKIWMPIFMVYGLIYWIKTDIIDRKKKFEIKKIEFIDESDLVKIPKTKLKYNNIEIIISSNSEESLKHVKEDYEVLMKEGIENFIKTNFITWLKGNDFKDLDDDKIYDGLKLTDVSYSYKFICDKYSPTKKDDYFGEFTFSFESDNKYTENLLQASEFSLLINNGKIYYGGNHDI